MTDRLLKIIILILFVIARLQMTKASPTNIVKGHETLDKIQTMFDKTLSEST